MVQQIPSRPLAGSRRRTIRSKISGILSPASRPVSVIAAFIIMTTLPCLRAESLASKNNEGNRLYSQGKYEDAEKAYLDAQVKSPGRPEVLYNLGNSLIMQEKFEQGIQSLRQSRSKGDKGIQENSWYNAGNAFFEMGNYKESADAFIQALKMDPTDQDAKHNLELALLRMQQQKQESEGKRDPSPSGKKNQPQVDKDNKDGSGQRKEQNKPGKQQTPKPIPSDGSISKERALQILDALQGREREEQRKLMERQARSRPNVKDW